MRHTFLEKARVKILVCCWLDFAMNMFLRKFLRPKSFLRRIKLFHIVKWSRAIWRGGHVTSNPNQPPDQPSCNLPTMLLLLLQQHLHYQRIHSACSCNILIISQSLTCKRNCMTDCNLHHIAIFWHHAEYRILQNDLFPRKRGQGSLETQRLISNSWPIENVKKYL